MIKWLSHSVIYGNLKAWRGERGKGDDLCLSRRKEEKGRRSTLLGMEEGGYTLLYVHMYSPLRLSVYEEKQKKGALSACRK